MTVHRDNSLWIKPTDAPNSSFIGLHVSGSLSAHHQEFLAVHGLWYILCRFYDRLLPGVGWNCKAVPSCANGHQICVKCTNADVWLGTPDDGQKDCPKHVSRNTNKIRIRCVCWFYWQGNVSHVFSFRKTKKKKCILCQDVSTCGYF